MGAGGQAVQRTGCLDFSFNLLSFIRLLDDGFLNKGWGTASFSQQFVFRLAQKEIKSEEYFATFLLMPVFNARSDLQPMRYLPYLNENLYVWMK
jgi:hypothetical protein